MSRYIFNLPQYQIGECLPWNYYSEIYGGTNLFQSGMKLYQSGMISFQNDSKFMAEYDNTCLKLYTGFTFGKNSFKI